MKNIFYSILICSLLLSCSTTEKKSNEVNLYSQRHYAVDELQYKNFTKLTGIKVNVVKANADECKQVTGFSIGGVAPVAHLHTPARIFIDENLNRFNMVYAAAGHPFVVFGITYDNLCLITKAEINSIVQ